MADQRPTPLPAPAGGALPPDPLGLDERKRALRALVRGRCRLPASEAARAASEAAQARLLESDQVAGARVIAIYLALPSEVQTAALERALVARGKTVCLPAVRPGRLPLSFHRTGGPLVRSALGIHEPAVAPIDPLASAPASADRSGPEVAQESGPEVAQEPGPEVAQQHGPEVALQPGAEVPLSSIELFVVPALAADPHGRRLGRGKGHYDATLAAASPSALRVALLFESALVPEVPVGEHDQLVDAICTEERLLRCPGRTAPAGAGAGSDERDAR